MDLINGLTLVKADGTKVGATEGLDGKAIVCLYFSAHWCPPCRAFTPVLKDFYEVGKLLTEFLNLIAHVLRFWLPSKWEI